MSDQTPDSWMHCTLGDLGAFSTSSVDKLQQPGERPVRLVNYMDVYRNRHIDDSLELMPVTATDAERVRYQVHRGDVLFTPSSETPDDIGHSAAVISDLPETLHSYHTVRLRPSGEHALDVVFSGYFANTDAVLRHFARRAAGSTRYTLSLGSFSDAPVNLPPLLEQRRIAEILSTVDEAIEQTEALIVKTQQIKAGLMHDLFTRGVMPNGELRPTREQAPHLYKESPNGWIPKEWEVVSLAKIADLDVGYAFRSAWFQSEGVNLLRGENVGYGVADWKDRQSVSLELAQQFAEYQLHPGDVVIGMDRTFTKSGFKLTVIRAEDCPALLVQRVGRFRALNCELSYLRWLLTTQTYLGALANQQKGMDIPHLSKSEILTPLVPIMHCAEQQLISNHLNGLESTLKSYGEEVRKYRLIKLALMHDLLTGRVRVRTNSSTDTEEVDV